MNKVTNRLYLLAVGFAMFSMFFGAGNVVFPLIVGKTAQDRSFFALIGLLITAVGVPFIGLLGMILFDGDYRAFFDRLGKIPGFSIVCLIMGLIGFGALPRCITLSYSTWQIVFPDTSLLLFSLSSLVVIYCLSIRKNRITEIVGGVLTPFLIAALGFIIIKGLIHHPPVPTSEINDLQALKLGLQAGYQTMDLLVSFFFCAVIIGSLKAISTEKSLLRNAVYASLIGAFALGLVYVGMSLVASFHSVTIIDTAHETLLGDLALHILGPHAGFITCVTVILACLTTAVALAVVFAEFIHKDIFMDSISYGKSLLITLIGAFFVSTLEFQGIIAFLAPIVQLIYPSLLVLSAANIAQKLWGFRYIKSFVSITFFISVIVHVYG